MTAQTLPRQQGTIIRCSYDGCTAIGVTGQVELRCHRAYLRSIGWIRGIVDSTARAPSHRRWDICPYHAPLERQLELERKRAQAERRAQRDEMRKASATEREERRKEKRREAAKRKRAAQEVQP